MPVGNDQHGVVGEQRWHLNLVSLEFVIGTSYLCLMIGGVFEFDDRQRQSIDEHDQIGTAVDMIFNDGELVDDQPVIVFGVVEIEQADGIGYDVSTCVAVLY